MTSTRTPWIVAAVCTYGTMMIYLTQVTLPFTVSLFLKPESAAFGWGRATLASGVMIATIAGGCMAPVAGRAVDRWGARNVIIPGTVVFALITMAMAWTDGSILQLYALFALLGASIRFTGDVAFAKLISGWFQRKRGIALGLQAGIGTGVGAAIGPWSIAYFIDHFGWRGAYIGIGLMILILKIPPYLLLREPPAEQPASPPTEEPRQSSAIHIAPGKTMREIVRTRVFWLIFLIVLFAGFGVGGILVHLLPLLEGRGMSEQHVKVLLSSIALSSTAGRIVTGYLLDRFQTPLLALPLYISVLAGALIVDYGPLDMAFVGVLIMGFGVGAEGGGATAYFCARFFGLRAFAEVSGYLLAATIVGIGVGPLVVGKLYDITGSYALALKIVEASLALSVLSIPFLGPYVFGVTPSIGAEPSPKVGGKAPFRLSAK
jgi:MFS family permease